MPWFPDWWWPNAQTLWTQLTDPSFSPFLLLRYALQCLALTLPSALADYALGRGILHRLRIPIHGPLRRAVSLALGMGLAGTGILFFGLFGRLTGKGLLLFTLIELTIGVWLSRPTRLLLPPRRLAWALLLAAPFLIPYIADLLLPVLDYDSNMYHMASARFYKEQGRITYQEGIRFNAQPHLPVLLYLRQWWLLGDANAVKLLNLEYLAILLFLFAWCARRFRTRTGVWTAAALALGSPIFAFSARTEYADFALATWLATGVFLLVQGGHRIRTPQLFLAGLLLGFAGASKLQGLVVVACFCLAATLLFFWSRRQFLPTLSRALWLGSGTLLAGLPWWLRSYHHTGSPFAPFLTNSPDVAALFQVNKGYGIGTDWLAFLQLPWTMIAVPPEKFADLFRFGPSLLLLLALGLFAAFRSRRPLDFGTLLALTGSFLFTLAWFRTGQVMRYEACLLPIWSLLTLSALARLRWRSSWPALLLLPLLVSTCLLASSLIRFGIAPPVTWPATQMALNAVLPYYRATRALVPLVRPGDRVYLWFCDDAKFYTPGLLYGDWFGAYTYTWLGNVNQPNPIHDLPTMLARLKAAGFRYVLVDRDRAARGGTIYGGDFLSTGIVKPFVPIPGVEVIYDDGRQLAFRLP